MKLPKKLRLDFGPIESQDDGYILITSDDDTDGTLYSATPTEELIRVDDPDEIALVMKNRSNAYYRRY